MSHPCSVEPFALIPLLLLFGCGGVLEPELASTADASGGTSTAVSASGGTGTTTDPSGGASTTANSDSLCAIDSLEPIPVLDSCSEVTLPCEVSSGGDVATDWYYTFAAIASSCGASCLEVELATVGNCVTQVRLLNEPFPYVAGITPEAIVSCATQKLLAQRWECVPRSCWSEIHRDACILM